MSAAGGCECGQVRYRLTTPPIVVNCCHCRDCQRISGSAFAVNAMIETDRIFVTAGTPKVWRLHRDGHGETRAWRCGTCATLLWADHPLVGDSLRFVRAGTLDAGEAMGPDVHFFVRSRHPWVVLSDHVPPWETLPPDHGLGAPLSPERQARMDAAMRRSGSETTGG